MKRVISIILIVVAMFSCLTLSGCGGDDDYSFFSNKYGSRTTKCAQSGCSNYIANSGDTAYCTAHSNKCLECYCYIDGDAMYCLDCLSNAADNINDDYNYDDDDDDYSYFSNKYGSRTTKCAQSGCSNYIANSGDTAYCTTHSNKCLECYCYIDGDAMYCLDCLSNAADDINDDYNYGYDYDDDNDYSHECYVCGDSAYSKYGSYYYCSSCLALIKSFS